MYIKTIDLNSLEMNVLSVLIGLVAFAAGKNKRRVHSMVYKLQEKYNKYTLTATNVT